MNRLKINGVNVSDPMTIQRFQELVQEDRDIMDEATISLDELLLETDIEAAISALGNVKEEDFDNY